MKWLLLYSLYGLWAIAFVVVVFYLTPPSPQFPTPPPGAVQSEEPGDKEDFKNRRAYFTDLSRQEVMMHYRQEMSSLSWRDKLIVVPTYRLNYPPEDATIYIKELTRSVFLEEIVHSFRESFFVNGFEAQVPKDAIIIDGREFQRKITVRYYRSSRQVRIPIAVAAFGVLFLLIREWGKIFDRKSYTS